MLYFLAYNGNTMQTGESPGERLERVRRAIRAAAGQAGRESDEITLVGVSKFQPAEAVVELFLAGLTEFGESRVQEAARKIPEVGLQLWERGVPTAAIRWHLIGRLQSNKAAKAAEIFDVIHSVDSPELVERLDRAATKLGKRLDCYIEVNVSGEETKAGVERSEASILAGAVADAPSLDLKGLMTIGPLTSDESEISRAFKQLADLRDELEHSNPAWGRLGLSMGMSDDFPIAILCGATTLRIGTALFGERRMNEELA